MNLNNLNKEELELFYTILDRVFKENLYTLEVIEDKIPDDGSRCYRIISGYTFREFDFVLDSEFETYKTLDKKITAKRMRGNFDV